MNVCGTLFKSKIQSWTATGLTLTLLGSSCARFHTPDISSSSLATLFQQSLVISGTSSAQAGQCVAMTVTSTDSLGSSLVVPVNVSVDLSSGLGGSFYDAPGCGSAA